MYEIQYRTGGIDMKGSMTTDLGVITIEPEVVAKYAGTVAVECFGIVGIVFEFVIAITIRNTNRSV